MSKSVRRILPILLLVGITLFDQLLKMYIVQNYELYQNYGEGFFNITYILNPAAGFSLGLNWPEPWRSIMLIVVPLIALTMGTIFLIRDKKLSFLVRISIGCILGGGFGNVIDRIFRPGGVVDMFDVTFFGIFGWERWPTFNIADIAIVVGALLMIGTLLFTKEERLYE